VRVPGQVYVLGSNSRLLGCRQMASLTLKTHIEGVLENAGKSDGLLVRSHDIFVQNTTGSNRNIVARVDSRWRPGKVRDLDVVCGAPTVLPRDRNGRRGARE
jgi:hypothetical protein